MGSRFDERICVQSLDMGEEISIAPPDKSFYWSGSDWVLDDTIKPRPIIQLVTLEPSFRSFGVVDYSSRL